MRVRARELTLAAGAVQVGLCAGAKAGTDKAEQLVPRNTCDLIKSFIGFKLARLCPYTESCDLVVGETTCDGKKKAYEAFGEHVPLHVMEVPQCKAPCDVALLRSEFVRYKQALETLTGNVITAASWPRPPNASTPSAGPCSAWRSFAPPTRRPLRPRRPARQPDQLLRRPGPFHGQGERTVRREMEARIARGKAWPQGYAAILLAGCPMAVPTGSCPTSWRARARSSWARNPASASATPAT